MTRPPTDLASPANAATSALRRLASLPLLERDALLSTMALALEGARHGRGRALLVHGEAGSGKTRLADEAESLARRIGLTAFTARCHDMEGAPALWPWTRIVRQIERWRTARGGEIRLDAAPSLLPPILAEDAARSVPSAHPESDALTESTDRFQRFEELTGWIREVAGATPLLILLDDLHWADPASVLLARYVVRELRTDPIAFVFLYRDTDVVSGGPLDQALIQLAAESQAFRLEGLSREATARLASYVAGFEVPDILATALRAQTGGNPLFLIEVLRMLATEGRLGERDGPTPEGFPLPETVRHTLEHRIDALSPEARAVLAQAAILGSEIDLEILTESLDGANASTALDEAERARLMQRVTGSIARWRFAHDLIRETLLATMPGDRRARLHLRAAHAIRRVRAAALDDHGAALAHHYLESAHLGTAREAIDFARRAAARAVAGGSFELAVTLLDRALRAIDLLSAAEPASTEIASLRARILIDRGHGLWQSGERRDARRAYREAIELARSQGDAVLFAEAAIGLAGRNDVLMDLPHPSVVFMEEALAALPEHDSRMRVRLLAHLVRAHYFGEDRERLSRWAREAVAVASRLDDPRALFTALEALHYALLVPAHLDERLAVASRLTELADRTGSLRFQALANLWNAFDELQKPDAGAADRAIAGLEACARSLRQPLYAWLATGLRATRALMQGRLEETERLVFRAFELGQRAGSPNAFMFFGTQLFHLRVAQGRAEELIPVMQKMVDETPALKVFRIGIPLIHAIADRREEARRTFDEVAAREFADVPNDLHRMPMLVAAASVCAYLGDRDRAELLHAALAAEEGRIILSGICTYWEGPVDLALAQLEGTLGRLDEAIRHYDSAIRDAADAGALLLEAQALLECAVLLERRGSGDDPTRAHALRRRAQSLHRTIGIRRSISPLVREEVSHVSNPSDPASRPETDPPSTFLRRGGVWVLEFRGKRAEVPDAKGLRYLHRLIQTPEQDVHVLDLIAPAGAGTSSPRSTIGSEGTPLLVRAPVRTEALDARARDAYRERLRELEALRSEAERRADLGRVEVIDREREQIEAELEKAFGLGLRPRALADPVERARKSVLNRIRSAIRAIERVLPELGRHLAASIRTGTTCSYRPERGSGWRLE